jgi:hypothetical protein
MSFEGSVIYFLAVWGYIFYKESWHLNVVPLNSAVVKSRKSKIPYWKSTMHLSIAHWVKLSAHLLWKTNFQEVQAANRSFIAHQKISPNILVMMLSKESWLQALSEVMICQMLCSPSHNAKYHALLSCIWFYFIIPYPQCILLLSIIFIIL